MNNVNTIAVNLPSATATATASYAASLEQALEQVNNGQVVDKQTRREVGSFGLIGKSAERSLIRNANRLLQTIESATDSLSQGDAEDELEDHIRIFQSYVDGLALPFTPEGAESIIKDFSMDMFVRRDGTVGNGREMFFNSQVFSFAFRYKAAVIKANGALERKDYVAHDEYEAQAQACLTYVSYWNTRGKGSIALESLLDVIKTESEFSYELELSDEALEQLEKRARMFRIPTEEAVSRFAKGDEERKRRWHALSVRTEAELWDSMSEELEEALLNPVDSIDYTAQEVSKLFARTAAFALKREAFFLNSSFNIDQVSDLEAQRNAGTRLLYVAAEYMARGAMDAALVG